MNEANKWTIHEVIPDEGYAGAIVVEGNDYKLKFYEWAW